MEPINRIFQERFEQKYIKTDGCWEWIASLNPNGYGKMNINGKTCAAHRISYRLYVGDIADGMCVCHSCDNPRCVNPSHLFLGTQLENIHDMLDKHRQGMTGLHGEKHFNTRLTDKQVIEIRERWRSGESIKSLSETYPVSRDALYKIVKNITWKHL